MVNAYVHTMFWGFFGGGVYDVFLVLFKITWEEKVNAP